MKNSEVFKKFEFEVRLVVIAILIPLFLDSLPNLVDRIATTLSIFQFNLIRGVSLILGISWFTILLIGLTEFETQKKKIFKISFRVGVLITILLLIALVAFYAIYLFNLWLGYETIIYSTSFIAGIITAIISFIVSSKKVK